MTAVVPAPIRPPGRRDPAIRRWLTRLLVTAAALAVWLVHVERQHVRPGATRDPLLTFLVAMAVVVLVSSAASALVRRIGQPPVVGQIVGGLLLGPSVLGTLVPGSEAWLFPPAARSALDLTAQLGLIVFIFCVSSELDLAALPGGRRRLTLVTAGSIVLPFAGGTSVALGFHPWMAGAAGRNLGGMLFFGLAVSITAVPVLARILSDLGIERTPAGTLALGSAAVGDGIAWAVLTVILAVTVNVGTASALTASIAAAGLVLAVFVVLRPLLAWFVERLERHPSGIALLTPILLCGAVTLGAATQAIGLHTLVGAFLFGLAVPRHRPIVDRVRERSQSFVLAILLPLFFAGIGLSVSLGMFAGVTPWLLLGVVVLVSVATKVAGAGLGARLGGLPAGDAWRIGVLLNCRGVTEVVMASIGLQTHLINILAFTVLVLMALITTAATTPVLKRLELRHPLIPRG